MMKGRMVLGNAPRGGKWGRECRVVIDGKRWLIWSESENIGRGYVNFKITAEERVRGSANYWLAWGPDGITKARDVERMKENNPNLFEEVRAVMERVYGREASRPIDVPREPAQGQSALV
jgi:hypothetical protein